MSPSVLLLQLGYGRAGMRAVPVEWFADMGHPITFQLGCDQEPPIVVERVVPSFRAVQKVAPHKHAVSGDGVAEEQADHVGRWADVALQWLLEAAVAVVVGEAKLCRPYSLHLSAYLAGKPYVVLVADGNEVARSPEHGCMEVAVESHLLHIAVCFDEARVVSLVSFKQVPCVVCGAVVLHDDFVQGVVLRQDGFHLLAQKTPAVVGAHDDRHTMCCIVLCFHSEQS